MTSRRCTELGRIGAHRTRGGLRVRAHWANRPEETRRAQGLRREDRIRRADAAKLAIRNFRDLIPGVADGERVVGQNWIGHEGKKPRDQSGISQPCRDAGEQWNRLPASRDIVAGDAGRTIRDTGGT